MAQLFLSKFFSLPSKLQLFLMVLAGRGFCSDPQQWSAEQSGRWISEMAAQFQLAAPPRQLCLAGRSLCAMNQDEFLARAPCGGDTLHAQLQLWKTGVVDELDLRKWAYEIPCWINKKKSILGCDDIILATETYHTHQNHNDGSGNACNVTDSSMKIQVMRCPAYKISLFFSTLFKDFETSSKKACPLTSNKSPSQIENLDKAEPGSFNGGNLVIIYEI